MANRSLFVDRLQQAALRAAGGGRAVAAIVLDLDRFKIVNDAMGPVAGDHVLRKVGNLLGRAVRDGDTVARLGSDEFGVVLADMQAPADAARVAEKISRIFAGPIDVGGKELVLSASAGVAVCPPDGTDAQELLKRAGTALSRAKEAGPGGWRFYSADMDAHASEFVNLAARLRLAIARNELRPHFQPYFDIRSGQLVGMEALLRWTTADGGIIFPDKFIPVLEDTGLIIAAGERVIGDVCRRLRLWRDAGRCVVPIAINLSANQFRDRRLVDAITRATSDSKVEAELLVFELTESTFMMDIGLTRDVLETLKRMGSTIAIDDFGTGYSSLSHIKRFPVDLLKIDRAFVRDIDADPDDKALVTAIISMAHSLGIRTIAEGVETSAQLQVLRDLGCDMVQGYLFAKPMPPEEEERLFSDGRHVA